MQAPTLSELTRLEEITQAIHQAREAIALAGSLAHSDPDDAWNAVVEAKDHCSAALSQLSKVQSLRADDLASKFMAMPATATESRNAAEIHQLLSLLNSAARSDVEEISEEALTRAPMLDNAGLERAAIVNHVADLCKQAVEEGIAAHDLSGQKPVRDAIWHSVMASVEAMYALLLIGATLPDDVTLRDETDLDLAGLDLVDKVQGHISHRASRNRN